MNGGLESPCIKLGCSACCHDIDIRLTAEEKEFLRQGGSEVVELPLQFVVGGWGGSVASTNGYSHIKGGCGYLTSEGLCAVYEDPRRPNACAKLRPGPGGFLGCNGCNDIRASRGLRPLRKDGTLK